MTTDKRKKKPLNVLVTGGSGFLGSHIADAISDAGHSVTIFDKNESPYIKGSQRMISGDILDPQALSGAMRGMDIIVHLAALADIDIAHNNPTQAMNVNVMGTVNVMEAARRNNVKRVVFSSTIYVHSRTGSFYRVSKHACELLLEAYYERYGIGYTILRFGTLYGPRTDEHNSVFRYLKEAFKTGKINYYGSGNEIREYIHVCDAAEICVKALGDEFLNQTLILTGHHRMKISELLTMINEILGSKVKIKYNPKNSQAHYVQTPYSYIPRVGKKIVMNTYCDLGQSLVEMLDAMVTNHASGSIKFINKKRK